MTRVYLWLTGCWRRWRGVRAVVAFAPAPSYPEDTDARVLEKIHEARRHFESGAALATLVPLAGRAQIVARIREDNLNLPSREHLIIMGPDTRQ